MSLRSGSNTGLEGSAQRRSRCLGSLLASLVGAPSGPTFGGNQPRPMGVEVAAGVFIHGDGT